MLRLCPIPARPAWGRCRSGGAIQTKLLLAAGIVVAGVILAPTLLLQTPLRQLLLQRIVDPAMGSVAVEQASMGWFSPLVVHGVTFLDRQGNTLVEIEQLSLDRSLLALLQQGEDWGTIRLERPTFYLLARPDGSNLEDCFALPPSEDVVPPDKGLPPATSSPSFRLEIQQGRVLSRSAVTGQTWLVDSLSGMVTQPAGGMLSVQAAGEVHAAEGAPAAAGRFECRWTGTDERQACTLQLATEQLPVAVLEPWLQRLDPQLRMVGTVSSEMSLAIPASLLRQAIPLQGAIWSRLVGESRGRLRWHGGEVVSSFLAGIPTTWPQLELNWNGSVSGGQLVMEKLSLASDIVVGSMQLALPTTAIDRYFQGDGSSLAVALAGQLTSQGRVHLARLAQQWPEWAQIRQGTTITDGELQFDLRSEPITGGQQVNLAVQTTPLAGQAAGRAIRWDAPLAVNLQARQLAGQLRLDRLACQSEFLHLAATGDARQLQLQGDFDLDQLAERLSAFVDLSGWQLGGQGAARLGYQTLPGERFTAEATGNLRNLVVIHRNDTLAQEPKLDWKGTFQGSQGVRRSGGEWSSRMSQGQLAITAGGDELAVDLTEAIELGTSWQVTDWPLKLRTTGNVTRWMRRLRPWVDLSGWQLAGEIDLAAQGRVQMSPLNLHVDTSQLVLAPLEASSEAWLIREPRVEWSGDLSWDATTGTFISRNGQLLSSTVAASLRDWFWSPQTAVAQQVRGLAAARVNLRRLLGLRKSAATSSSELVGEVAGQVQLASRQGQLVAEVDLSSENLAVEQPQPALPGQAATMATVWREPQLRVVGTVAYDPAADRLVLEKLRTESQTLALVASGSIDELSTTGRVDLTGTIDYDLAKITPLLGQYVGPGLQIVGREQAQLALRGSLAKRQVEFRQTSTTNSAAGSGWASGWQGRLRAPWQAATMYGLPIGQGALIAELDQGQVRIEPLDFTVGEGRLTATPAVQLLPAPGKLTLAPGPLLTDVRVTPDVSERMLRYIAPVLAGATRSEGLFSMRIDRAEVPLGKPKTAEIAGQLQVTSVKVVPGPMVNEWIQLARQIEALARGHTPQAVSPRDPVTLLSVRDRSLDYQLAGGRVYHQGLEFQIGDVLLRSRGSVGLDETLSLMIEVPIQERWIADKPVLAGLRGQSIEVPLTGTFTRWRLDAPLAIGRATQLFARDAVRGAVEHELNRALQKWLGDGK